MEIFMVMAADSANKSVEGKINILGGFSELYSSAVPLQYPHIALVVGIEMDPHERGQQQSIHIKVCNTSSLPLDAPLWQSPELRFAMDSHDDANCMRNYLIFNIQGLVFPEFGRYSLQIYSGNSYKNGVEVDFSQGSGSQLISFVKGCAWPRTMIFLRR